MANIILQKVHFPQNTYLKDLPLYKFQITKTQNDGDVYTITTDLNTERQPLIEMILNSDDIQDNAQNFVSYYGVQLTNKTTKYPTSLFIKLCLTIQQNFPNKTNLGKAIIFLAYYFNLQTLDINQLLETLNTKIYNDERFISIKPNFNSLQELSDEALNNLQNTLNIALIEPYIQIEDETAEYRFSYNPENLNLGILTFTIVQKHDNLINREILIPLPTNKF